MFRKPGDKHPLLFIMERIAGMGWLLATDTIYISLLSSEGAELRFRAHTEFDSAEFEFLKSYNEDRFGTISSKDLQWTKASVERSHDAIELDSMRCYAGMYALERYCMLVPYVCSVLDIRVVWLPSEYTVLILPSPVEHDERAMQWIFTLAPNLEITSMIPASDR